MASQAKLIQYGPSTALLLAHSLNEAEDQKSAIAVLRVDVIRYPGDVWTNFELARLLSSAQPPQLDEAIRYYTAVRALRPETGWDLANILELQGRNDEAEATYRDLVRRNPKNLTFLFSFFQSLQKNGKLNEARSIAERVTAPFRDRLRREPHNRLAHRKLGELLWVTGNRSGAIAAIREAARIFPKSSDFHYRLGQMLLLQEDFPGAIIACRKAIQGDPADLYSHYHLASALGLSGDREGEIAELREVIRVQTAARNQSELSLRANSALSHSMAPSTTTLLPVQRPGAVKATVPVQSGLQNEDAQADGVKEELEPNTSLFEEEGHDDFLDGYVQGAFSTTSPFLDHGPGPGHLALGIALAESGDPREAIIAFTEATRVSEIDNMWGKAALYYYIGSARRLSGDLPGAITAYRKAIPVAIDQTLVPYPERQAIEARYALGMTLVESGDLSGAITAFREANQLEGRDQVGPFRLLRAILMAQRPQETIAALRRVRKQEANDKAIAEAIDLGITQYEHLSKLAVSIPRILRAPTCQAPAGDTLATHCYGRRFFTASAAIWSAGFATDPKMADDMEAHNRYNAACSAALAAAGKGIDRPALDEQAKARWRRQALNWLKADLAYWSKQAETRLPETTARVRQILEHWKADPDLAGLRKPDARAKLPYAERKDWQAFWSGVADLLKRSD